MLTNQNIICISSIDWDFIWQGHQEIMSTFAANGNTVFFIENTGVRAPKFTDIPRIKKRIANWFKSVKGVKKIRDNLYIYSPIILPFPYSRIARWINSIFLIVNLKRWMNSMQFGNPIVWTFLPTPLAMDIANSVNRKALVYHCVDNFSASSSATKKIEKCEAAMIKAADMVFVTSRELEAKCRKHSDKVSLFPSGINIDVYKKAADDPDIAVPEDMKPIKGPVIGYVGGIHKWVDMTLIRQAVMAYPAFSFVFIGPVQVDISMFRGLPNVYFLGQKDHTEVPSYVKRFSVGIIPYLITEYTKNVYPAKLNGYLALGKPVVSTAISEIVNFDRTNPGMVHVAQTNDMFIRQLKESVFEEPSEVCSKRKAIARQNTWQTKIDQMSEIIERELATKRLEIDRKWKDRLTAFYLRTKKKTVYAAAAFAAGYLLLFHTSLLWVAAGPLKIESAMPARADAIVVLGGGVGESGKAGQGYEERVEYAVQLYKKGYAGHIIFSSGYKYIFNETLVMKALAVSLGVPQDAIVLEDRTSNTYESVLFTKEILDKEHWNNIILLSSPYHMLRVSKVFSKVGGDTHVSYIPIPHSSFYAHPAGGLLNKKINMQQISGILHEYIGIIYYWWKGWI